MLGALSTSALLGARGGRALDDSRGEPAFVFELGERTLALVLEGLGTKSHDRPRGARAAGRQPLRRRRLRRRRRDPQRPRLRGRAAAGRQRLLRHRRLAPGTSTGTAPRRCWRAGGGPARTPAACGAGGVAVAPGDARRAGDRARRGRRRRPARRCRADPRRRAGRRRRDRARGTRAACTPTAPRWRGCVAERLPEGFATPLATGARFGEALLDPTRDVRGAGGGAAAAAAWPSATSATSPATGC